MHGGGPPSAAFADPAARRAVPRSGGCRLRGRQCRSSGQGGPHSLMLCAGTLQVPWAPARALLAPAPKPEDHQEGQGGRARAPGGGWGAGSEACQQHPCGHCLAPTRTALTACWRTARRTLGWAASCGRPRASCTQATPRSPRRCSRAPRLASPGLELRRQRPQGPAPPGGDAPGCPKKLVRVDVQVDQRSAGAQKLALRSPCIRASWGRNTGVRF